jgi:phosphoglycerate kinase
MSTSTLSDITRVENLKGKRVIVRASLDVPIEHGVVVNEFRIEKALPTIKYLVQSGARVLLLTHVGRDPKNTTEPIFHALKKHITIHHTEAIIGLEVQEQVAALQDGEVLLLGNLRAYKEEEENNKTFSETLASYADIYVNDAFAVSHRAHASIVGIPAYIPGYAGITFKNEYENLSRALSPEHPALFILGGAKFETKAPLIERYADSYDAVALGGALANDFLKGRGYEVGVSLVSPIDLSQNPIIHKSNIIIPMDVVVRSERGTRDVGAEAVVPDESILDIGPRSIEALTPHINDARTILWNGPLGYYEGGFDAATKACAKLIAESDAFSIVGGGDTVAAIEALGISDKFGFLSTAGGAMLEFLENGTLPGIEPLLKSEVT